MRTTNQIICAVKDCEPVSEDELRLAVVALSGIEHFIRHDLQTLIESIRNGESPGLQKMKAEFAWGTIERMFTAIKTPPDQWLGPSGTPGTPENTAAMNLGRKIFKAATGEDL